MRRILSIALCVLALAGLTASAASSSSPDRAKSPASADSLKADSFEAVSNGPQDTTCVVDDVPIVCEFGVSSVRQPDGRYNYFMVHASNRVIWHRTCGPCGWYPVGGATAHSGVAAIAYATGVLTMFRMAGTQEAFFCRWYSSVSGDWAAPRACG